MWGLDLVRGRHRRPEPSCVVTLVFADLSECPLPAESALARSIGQVASLLSLRA